MAVLNPPGYLQLGSHPALLDRIIAAGFLSTGEPALTARGGRKPSRTAAASAAGGRDVRVQGGHYYVPSSTGLGVYVCVNDAAMNITIPPSSSSGNRRDLIVIRVYDADVAATGGRNEWALEVVPGTTATSPVRPATPANSLAVADIRVNANTTSVTEADITPLLQDTVGSGGVLPLNTEAERPTNAYPGSVVYIKSNKSLQVWDADQGWNAWYSDRVPASSGIAFVRRTELLVVTTATIEIMRAQITAEAGRTYLVEATLPGIAEAPVDTVLDLMLRANNVQFQRARTPPFRGNISGYIGATMIRNIHTPGAGPVTYTLVGRTGADSCRVPGGPTEEPTLSVSRWS